MTHDIRVERFGQVRPELTGMLCKHLGEVGVDVGLEAKPDFGTLERLDAMGVLLLLVARVSGHPVGYIFWTLDGTNLEYAGTPTAHQGPWYVRPEHRRSTIATSLFKRSIGELRRLGVVLVEPHFYHTPEGPRLGAWFESMGAKPQMTTYLLNLKSEAL